MVNEFMGVSFHNCEYEYQKNEMLCSKTFKSLNRYERPEKTTKQFKLVKVV